MDSRTQAERASPSKTGEPRPLRDGSPEGPARLQTAGGVTILGAVANAVLVALKTAAGLAGGSSVLVADAVHSLSDLATDILVLLGLRVASKPPDEEHPYGHGRYETLSTVLLAGVLLVVAAGIAWDASSRFGETGRPATITLWAAALSIAVKETLFHVTLRAGRRCHSSLVIANAWHHRSDALSSVAAFAGILGARMGFPILDPAAAVVVAALIAKMALQLLVEAIREVTDATLERDILHELGADIRRLPGVVSFHELRARRMGPRLLVDLHVEVEGSTTVSDGHQVAERVRQLVFQKQAGVSEVLVHVDPEPDEDLQPGDQLARPREEIEKEVRRIALGVVGVRAVTHVMTHFLECRVVLQIEIEVDPRLRVHEAAQVARVLRRRVEEISGVDHADIHLELDDLAHQELPPTLQGPRSQGSSGGESGAT
jgi:cation diffusion facilitator family transporter